MNGSWRTGRDEGRGFSQFYREWQPAHPSSMPVLALHGSLTQSGMWLELAERLGSVPMLCPDQRGFGLSGEAAGDACADFAEDALALGQALPPGRLCVTGHSFACSIALEVALRASDRVASVVLVDPIVRLAASRPPEIPPPNPESFDSLEEAEAHWGTEEGEWPEGSLRRFTRDVMIQDGSRWRFPYTNERLRRLRTATASPQGDWRLLDKARAVRCPVLVFRGGQSRRFAANAEPAFREAFGRPIEIVVCPRSGHFPTSTEPHLVEEAMRAFLDAVP